MAAAKTHSRKGKRSRKNNFLCFFGGCFGISNKVSAEHGGGKSVKNVSSNSGGHGRALPVNDHKIPMPLSSEIVKSTKEIHVIKDMEIKTSQILASPEHHELISCNKTHEKSKHKEKSSPIKGSEIREKRRNPNKVSQSASQPVPCQRRDEEVGKKERELEPVVGAVIVMVTLVVMLLWGKVWAILCTAAWFYSVPRFRANEIKLKNEDADLDSWEYKKMVVLQGLLHRN